jgi:hypothetical protein
MLDPDDRCPLGPSLVDQGCDVRDDLVAMPGTIDDVVLDIDDDQRTWSWQLLLVASD